MTNSQQKRIGTVCMTGTFNDGKFKAYKDTTIGTITQRSMLNICNVDVIDDLTSEHIQQHKQALQAKLLSKVKQNLQALRNQLQHIASLPIDCRLFRISSNLLPLFDHPMFSKLYDQAMLAVVDVGLLKAKNIIDFYDIRVCTHPDQFVVVNSTTESVRVKSYTTLYYHKFFMERLTTSDQTSINIHLNGNLDHLPELDNGLYADLIPWLSFENEDKNGKLFTGSTINTLEVCERYNIKMLFDLHHHLALEGEHLPFNSNLIQRIVDTWQGVRPLMHLSQGRETSTDRKHSDYIDNDCLVVYAREFLKVADLELECKAKGSAVSMFYNAVCN